MHGVLTQLKDEHQILVTFTAAYGGTKQDSYFATVS